MSEKVLQPGTTISLDLEKIMERTGKGKIKIKAKNKSRYALQALMVTLLGLTVVAFATFDYQNIDFAEGVQVSHRMRMGFGKSGSGQQRLFASATWWNVCGSRQNRHGRGEEKKCNLLIFLRG